VREAGYIVGAGPDTAVLVGGVLEFIVALACIGTAIALYPVVKRQNAGFAMGFVGTRVLEAALIVVGIACLWTVVTLRQAGVGADAQLTGQVLVGIAFIVGFAVRPLALAAIGMDVAIFMLMFMAGLEVSLQGRCCFGSRLVEPRENSTIKRLPLSTCQV
jgi:hypothetical protein